MTELPTADVEGIVKIIQSALTPVFLLAGTAGFLNVYSSRLARVSDRINNIVDGMGTGDVTADVRNAQLRVLRRRTIALEIAVIFGALTGIFVCAAILGLFVGQIERTIKEDWLYWNFGMGLLCLSLSLWAFIAEMLLATGSMIRQIAKARRSS
ncbi:MULTISPECIES: DUF2721 domain-containing protein [unclassified Beijerinckia]|uniref:DUF2721 domain-containing protein n=1 Tax=unclassified Beijerinckia TaxID=2638183 RepID=UPI00089555D8|nr:MULTISPECIES: DUF2721 domain-containing protein [unclassified Beijerinckia]MDH7794745.1 hypothetical protein [Beijerinckia sp. GAS462]SEB73585.1 Protein of unknown function [Beijerinckia sp. 28-YEA-48]